MADLLLNPLPPADGSGLRPLAADPAPAAPAPAPAPAGDGQAAARPAFSALLLALRPQGAPVQPPGLSPPLPGGEAGVLAMGPEFPGPSAGVARPDTPPAADPTASQPDLPAEPLAGQLLPASGDFLPVAGGTGPPPGGSPSTGNGLLSGAEPFGATRGELPGHPAGGEGDRAATLARNALPLPDLELVRGGEPGRRDALAAMPMPGLPGEAGRDGGESALDLLAGPDRAGPPPEAEADGDTLRLPAPGQSAVPARDLAELLRNFRPGAGPSPEGMTGERPLTRGSEGAGAFATRLLAAGSPGVSPASTSTFPALAPLGPAEAWAGGLADRMLMLAGDGTHTARLRLYPEHLGTLEVRITVEDGAAQVLFNSHNAQAREALEAALPRLRELFADQGLQLIRAEVGSGGNFRGEAGDAGPERRSPWTDDLPGQAAGRRPADTGERPMLAALLGAQPQGNRLIDLWA